MGNIDEAENRLHTVDDALAVIFRFRKAPKLCVMKMEEVSAAAPKIFLLKSRLL
jgi:hypothetical protein